MQVTKEEVKEQENSEVLEDTLSFYEKIKIKNNMESIFNHYSGSYVFIEVNPWKDEYTIRGKFHVKYGIYSKFEIQFDGIEKLRTFSEYIESIAFLKNTCEENIKPVLNNKNELIFLYNEEVLTEKNIEEVLKQVKSEKGTELFNINEEIKQLYNRIEEIDNDIKYKKEQIKNMEIKIREAKEATGSFLAALKYVTLTGKNSLTNRIKSIFKKDRVLLNR